MQLPIAIASVQVSNNKNNKVVITSQVPQIIFLRQGFALECLAMKNVRDRMGLCNVILMIPFCRTPKEGQRVLLEMAKHGLVWGENGL
jgi:phosphoenolpyruvate synthase/pyruvate phosphate dikinase